MLFTPFVFQGVGHDTKLTFAATCMKSGNTRVPRPSSTWSHVHPTFPVHSRSPFPLGLLGQVVHVLCGRFVRWQEPWLAEAFLSDLPLKDSIPG